MIRRGPTTWILMVVALMAHGTAQTQTSADGDVSVSQEKIKNQVLQLMVKGDSFQAIQFLASQQDPVRVLDMFHRVVKSLYWEQKDLTATVAMGRAGIQYGLTTAATIYQRDPRLAYQLSGKAKEIAYDIASFTWPGWSEETIVIDDGNLIQGQDSAKTALRLSKALKQGNLPISRAYWAVGAHHLATGRFEGAKISFLEAIRYATAAEAAEFVLLLRGYVYMVEILKGNSRFAMNVELNFIKAQLMGTSEGETYREQLETALSVFSRNSGNYRGSSARANH